VVKNSGIYKACLEAYKTAKVTKRGTVTANLDSSESFGSFAGVFWTAAQGHGDDM